MTAITINDSLVFKLVWYYATIFVCNINNVIFLVIVNLK